MARGANPTDSPCGVPHHERVVGYVLNDDRSRADECPLANRNWCDARAVGPDGGTRPDCDTYGVPIGGRFWCSVSIDGSWKVIVC